MPFRIAIVGAGSLTFTQRLIQDILTVPEFHDVEIALTDINRTNLLRVAQLIKRDIAANKLAAKVIATTDRRKALAGAKYVLCAIRVGGLEAFKSDIEIPLKYGVDQCVGDTLGPGGILYGQRGIPVMLDICKDIREVAAPGCLFMNYSNPMAILTWACSKYGGVDTVGLCHGVQDTREQVADALGVPTVELDIVAAGINHQTWFLRVEHKGRDMRKKLLAAFEKHPVYSKTEKVRIDLLKRFGYYTTESNGHCSEYVAWYRKRRKEIKQWIDTREWIHGETGGYLNFCTRNRAHFDKQFGEMLKVPPARCVPEERSHEHASYIIEARETGRVYRGHFNRINRGAITNLPEDCVIEAPGFVDSFGIQMSVFGDLPMACAATCSASVHVQRMAMEAGITGDRELLRQAMLHDPLTAAVCSPPEVWAMADEMLAAQAKWLPQYRGKRK